MARKSLSRVDRGTVESAVAKRYPHLSPEDQRHYVSAVIEYIADTINNGGYPASIFVRHDGDVELDYVTIEDILDRNR